MFALSIKNQWLAGGVLLLAMLLTRIPMPDHLQDASWAVFFLLGFYVRNRLAMPLFWLVAFAVDYAVTSNGMVSSYCFTPAYGFTFLAYAAMWGAGRWFAAHYRIDWRGLGILMFAVTLGVLVCFTVSNIGFYAFAGYFDRMGVMDYAASVVKYLPGYWQTSLLYVGIAAVLHMFILQQKNAGQRPAPDRT